MPFTFIRLRTSNDLDLLRRIGVQICISNLRGPYVDVLNHGILHFEEIITYNKMLEYISKDEESDIMWKLKYIIFHKGPLQKGHPEYRNSQYNIMIEWENGEITK
jgi:hypothetical protein